jgi:hypothetical protein
MIVTYDTAYGDFEFYSDQEWLNKLADWRLELLDDGYEGCEALDSDEVVEMMFGCDLSFTEVPKDKISS